MVIENYIRSISLSNLEFFYNKQEKRQIRILMIENFICSISLSSLEFYYNKQEERQIRILMIENFICSIFIKMNNFSKLKNFFILSLPNNSIFIIVRNFWDFLQNEEFQPICCLENHFSWLLNFIFTIIFKISSNLWMFWCLWQTHFEKFSFLNFNGISWISYLPWKKVLSRVMLMSQLVLQLVPSLAHVVSCEW